MEEDKWRVAQEEWDRLEEVQKQHEEYSKKRKSKKKKKKKDKKYSLISVPEALDFFQNQDLSEYKVLF